MNGAAPLGWIMIAALATSGCGSRPEPPESLRIAGADTGRGHRAMLRYGCGACHRIPGVPGARGLAGPPLEHF